MKFTELLTPESIRQGMILSSKKRVFELIAHIVAEKLQLENGEQCCFECLFSREKLGNSGLGGGVAMPKGRLPAEAQPIAVFIQLDSPIDYEAADHREVDLIFAVLIPENMCAAYVQYLPKLAENLTDKSLCKRLRAAKSADEILQIFFHYDQTDVNEAVPTKQSSEQDVTESQRNFT
ncbi:PTS IIA-like nitrogen regulatory protein PtsN [Aggregatibacter actinomycetemcomitans]|uniref:PTS IIA-like nitrogen regulatory protein PtsN n=1 Tax=Aggregatibacter actinomycetemcomitans TaxID=714 RepID=UPI00022ADB29|nr:PTS IIA-like nitrogen regulatory protein PtsN [Aggregatibacter actinomycetemcomitans]KOE67133.1 PTS sugar transporter subunit IIA [Aggregatibacter actinomycetemcomitans serotype e str. A160]KOE68785.1 PTS sugar transporter subunit IIA [Aggregatibacter actinomycetemcomitans serotype e str. SCC393]KOE70612.1 PTS sugar transporter subunit IIA [Aggregatibacter actinomycetemcomitans serotype f str. D18P1]KYK79211.1 PTS sugar transporter subunit IIA [Aggregatibacter actinomycetemcomitans serotype 